MQVTLRGDEEKMSGSCKATAYRDNPQARERENPKDGFIGRSGDSTSFIFPHSPLVDVVRALFPSAGPLGSGRVGTRPGRLEDESR